MEKGADVKSNTHGMSKTRVYSIWRAMKSRCGNKKHRYYYRYGGRGITVCERWLKFENFLADMREPPTPKHSIDRINNNLGYSPSNCRWATNKEQNRNNKRNFFIKFNGQNKVITDWAKMTGISRQTIAWRLKQGWTVEDALSRKGKNTRGQDSN